MKSTHSIPYYCTFSMTAALRGLGRSDSSPVNQMAPKYTVLQDMATITDYLKWFSAIHCPILCF